MTNNNITKTDEFRLHKILSEDEEKSLFKEYSKTKDIQIRNEILSCNYKLIQMEIKKWKKEGVSADDLFQEGIIGVMEAIEKYDYKSKIRFASYARYYITHYMCNCNHQSLSKTTMPTSRRSQISKMIRIEQNFYNKHERYPTNLELSDLLEIKEKTVKNNKIFCEKTSSLDAEFKNSNSNFKDSSTLLDTINDIDKENEFEQISKNESISIALKEINTLTEREQYILKNHFGLENKDKKTLEEIGKHFNITRERVRQIEAEALLKLRKKLEG